MMTPKRPIERHARGDAASEHEPLPRDEFRTDLGVLS